MDGDQHNSQIMTNLVCPPPFVSNQKLHSINAMKCSNDSNFDMFTMMKENALFLLELSSTNSRKFDVVQYFLHVHNKQIEPKLISNKKHLICTAILGNQRKLPYQMPVVSEHQISDQNRAGSSRSDQYASRFGKSFKCPRKSEASSPELIWSVPDMFLCLDSLGATVAKDSAPYDRIGYSESSFDRVSVMHNLSHFLKNF